MNWTSFISYAWVTSLLFLPAQATAPALKTPPAAPKPVTVKFVGQFAATAPLLVCDRVSPTEVECQDLAPFLEAVDQSKRRAEALEEREEQLKESFRKGAWL